MRFRSNYTGAEIDGILADASGVSESLAQLNTNIQTVLDAYPYQVRHEPVVVLSLEQEHQTLIENDSTLSLLSYVGARILLKQGDIIPVSITPDTYSRVFINGEEYTAPYTYEGENDEYAVVFYFSENSVVLSQTNLNIIDILIINMNRSAFNVDESWYWHVNSAIIKNPTYISPDSCKNFKVETDANFGSVEIPNLVDISFKTQYINEWRALFDSPRINKSKTPHVRKIIIDAPNLLHFSSTNIFDGNGLVNAEIYTLNTQKIGMVRQNCAGILVASFSNFKFPTTVNDVRDKTLGNIAGCVDLSDVDVATFENLWYWYSSPPITVVIGNDWKSTISLAIAGKNQSPEWFVELFGKLHDYAGGTAHTLTIPTTIYNELSDNDIAIATAKNWTITGA